MSLRSLTRVIALCSLLLQVCPAVRAGAPLNPADLQLKQRGDAYEVDLATVLRLSNSHNLEVQIARERLKVAEAYEDSAHLQFFPWLSPGIGYRRHDDLIQDVSGNLFNVHKDSYTPGVTLNSQLDFGDALYKSLASKQQTLASRFALEAQRQNISYNSIQDYYDLLLAQSLVEVARESLRVSTNYLSQIQQAVSAGLTFKGDELRGDVEVQRNRLAFEQALEKTRIASAQLTRTLHLQPTIFLIAHDPELVPFNRVGTNLSLGPLLAESHYFRPETRQTTAAIDAAREQQKGAVYGPLFPTIGFQYYAGGFGGSSSVGPSRFGNQEELFLGFSWKIGPGGLFDSTRKRTAVSRVKLAELDQEKVQDELDRQVVEAFTRVQSLTTSIELAKHAMEAAKKGLDLVQLRREFAVGIVLENIQAEQDYTRARGDYLKEVVEYNKSQYSLLRALGKL